MLSKKETFTFENEKVEGVLILENATSTVYKLPNLSHIGFSGTNEQDIEKEFPNFKTSVGELLDNTYILIKDGKVVLGYDYE